MVSTLLFVALVTLAMLDLLDEPVVNAGHWAPILSGINFVVAISALFVLLMALHNEAGAASVPRSGSSKWFDIMSNSAKVNAAVGKVGLACALLLTSWVFQNLMSDADGKGFVHNNALRTPDTCTCNTLSDFVRIYVMQKILLMLLVIFVVAGTMVHSMQLWVSMTTAEAATAPAALLAQDAQ